MLPLGSHSGHFVAQGVHLVLVNDNACRLGLPVTLERGVFFARAEGKTQCGQPQGGTHICGGQEEA